LRAHQPAREDVAYDLGERAMLEAWLEYHRATLAWKCDGLSGEQLRERIDGQKGD
jgi:hypothetical protein